MTNLYRIIPHRLHVPEKWRALIEEEVERLVRILDRIDGDADLEPDDEDAEHDGREPDTDGETDRSDLRGGSVLAMDDPSPLFPGSPT